ncbi:MAG TPA: phage tail protein [Arsenophonus sp.]
MDKFTWRTQIQDSSTGEFRHRIKEVEFSEGYKQVSADGIHPETQSWPFFYLDKKDEVMPIFDFICHHTVKALIWVPPFGVKGLYRRLLRRLSQHDNCFRCPKISAWLKNTVSGLWRQCFWWSGIALSRLSPLPYTRRD